MISTTQQHTGESLQGLPLIPPPEAKSHWVGLPHSMLLKSLLEQLRLGGIVIFPSEMHLSPKGEDFSWSGEAKEKRGLVHFGLLNSNSWQSATRVYIGTAFGPGRLPFPIDEVVLGKHTIRLVRELDSRMKAALKVLEGKHAEAVKELKGWKDRKCTDQPYQVLLDAIRKRLLPSERSTIVFDEMEKGGNTLASMMEGWVLAVRQGPTLKQLPTMLKFFNMLKETQQ